MHLLSWLVMCVIGLRGFPFYIFIVFNLFPVIKADCPEILRADGQIPCGFNLKEVAKKEGLFFDPRLRIDNQGGIRYTGESTFAPFWARPGSDVGVTFDPTGAFHLPEQFMGELIEAMKDERLFHEGSEVVPSDIFDLYPDPDTSAGGATVRFLDDAKVSIQQRLTKNSTSDHPESVAWEEFTKKLVFKANCVVRKIAIDKSKADGFFSTGQYFIREYPISCGVELEARLVAQMQATNLAMRMVFEQIAKLGRCIYPCVDCLSDDSKGYKDRKYCGKAIIKPMTLTDDGRLGLLSLAISFASAYGKLADSIVDPAYATYKDIVKKVFGCTYKTGLEVRLVETIRALARRKTFANRHNTCRAMIAHHRAFERTFLRFVAAIRAWMQSFAREISQGFFYRPCAKLFSDPFQAMARFCEAEAFKESTGEPINETGSCDDEDM